LSCGDAGRMIDPLTGEGIWHALYTGRLAGTLAAKSLGEQGVDRKLAGAYGRAVQRNVTWPTAARRGLEMMITFIVANDLYRSPAVRRFLEWGYHRSEFEVSKATDT